MSSKVKVVIFYFFSAIFFLTQVHCIQASELTELEQFKNDFIKKPFIGKYQDLKSIAIKKRNSVDLEEWLAPALSDEDIRINMLAVEILFKTDEKSAVNYIVNYLKTSSQSSHSAVLRILSSVQKLNSKLLFEEIYQYSLEENNPDVFIAVAKVLLKRLQQDEVKEKILTHLKYLFEKKDSTYKINILNLLAKEGNRYIPLISTCLNDSDPVVVNAAFKIAQEVGGAQIRERVYELKESPRKDVSYNAIVLLSTMGESSFLRIIEQDLVDDNPKIRLKALNFLISKIGEINLSRFDSLIKRIAQYDKNKVLRDRASDFLKYKSLAKR